MTTQVSSSKQTAISLAIPSLGQNLAAMAFGLIILFAIGFSPVEAAHNAAHDTRHALAFPCH